MMVVPAETVEDNFNDLLRYCREGDIIIDHGNTILRTVGKGFRATCKTWHRVV